MAAVWAVMVAAIGEFVVDSWSIQILRGELVGHPVPDDVLRLVKVIFRD